MIVVASSVWIDFFRGTATPAVQRFRQLMAEGVAQIVVPDVVLYEELRGFRHEREFRQARALLQALKIEPAVGENLALQAAEHYRHLCAAGVHREMRRRHFAGCVLPGERVHAVATGSGFRHDARTARAACVDGYDLR